MSRQPPTPRVIAARYRLDEEIARGGMGVVWRGMDTKLGRPVAVKLMTVELSPEIDARGRFEREARILASLQSAHIVEVYDNGVDDNQPYMVMELLVGEDLRRRMMRVTSLSVADTADMLTHICRGLRAAHEASLVHRDIKPSNIFIAKRDDQEVVKLLDFGVVKALDGGDKTHTSTGLALGTPQYMSPEQTRALKEVDHRSDLWSVAVIAFRLLTGKNPFSGGSVGDVAVRICAEDVPPLSSFRSDLPAPLDPFFDKALARDPADRFQSADALVRAFCNATARNYDGLSSGGFGVTASPSGLKRLGPRAESDASNSEHALTLLREVDDPTSVVDRSHSLATESDEAKAPAVEIGADNRTSVLPAAPANSGATQDKSGKDIEAPTLVRESSEFAPLAANVGAYTLDDATPPPRRRTPLLLAAIGAVAAGGMLIVSMGLPNEGVAEDEPGRSGARNAPMTSNTPSVTPSGTPSGTTDGTPPVTPPVTAGDASSTASSAGQTEAPESSAAEHTAPSATASLQPKVPAPGRVGPGRKRPPAPPPTDAPPDWGLR